MPELWNKKILEVADVQKLKPDLTKTKLLSRDSASKIQVVVFSAENKKLLLLTTNNFPDQLKQLVSALEKKGYIVELYYTGMEGFEYAMSWYDLIEQATKREEEAKKAQSQAAWQGALSMMKRLFDSRETMEPGDFIMEIVKLAYQAGASDLHFQSEEKGIISKVRIDGVLHSVLEFSHADFEKYLQKIKFIAGTKMNISYVPQDGRFSFEADIQWSKQKIDARCNFMPGVNLENVVIRFLNRESWLLTMEQLGIVGKNYDVFKEYITKNTGLIIVSGPTGSGKTTTLYSILQAINDGEKKIITLEDPIEYQLDGIEQSQINYTKGYSFEVWLKACLRHDPDIILVGETRTLETAEIALNASLTGHLVFTTLHTNSAIEAISRLLSMGVKPYMLAPALHMVSAQRLVRKLDASSMTRREANYAEAAEIKDALKKIKDVNPHIQVEFDGTIPEAVATDNNNQTGYKGRLAITEIFEVSDDIKKLIVNGSTSIDLYAKARENGHLTLKEDGIIKVLQWLTTLEELRRVL
jgi:type II secretory ATPase GspE/PulE/Tfp pilus assembly ATPase PilB-like protein